MNNQRPIKELATIISVTTIGTFLFSYIAFVIIQDRFPSSLLTLWNWWDTPHYIDIAKKGYSNTTTGERYLFIVFFPLYPLLIRLFALSSKNYVLSALIVSNLAYCVSAFYLYRLTLLDYPKEIALRATFYFSIFP